jgi:hypothetical protein
LDCFPLQKLFNKHPDTSVLVTINEQGDLVFPGGEAFTPDASVRLNIVGHSEKLEAVGAKQLAIYTDSLMRYYNINSTDNSSYLFTF